MHDCMASMPSQRHKIMDSNGLYSQRFVLSEASDF